MAAGMRTSIQEKIQQILAEKPGRRPPFLAAILVGDNPASEVYVGAKQRACASVGITSQLYRLPIDTTQEELAKQIHALNLNPEVDGILLQLPLPEHLKALEAVLEIDPDKDADGLTPTQQGRLNWNIPGVYPCTALAVLLILDSLHLSLEGKVVAIVGQSVIVGAPTASLLAQRGATVIQLNEHTKNPAEFTRQADILISATGVVHLVRKEWVKPGAVVIDVGIKRVGDLTLGDVYTEEVATVASHITPVPGGVGPVTVAVLLQNCLEIYLGRLLYL